MSSKSPNIRAIVDDYFNDVGSIIASYIYTGNTKLGDLFRSRKADSSGKSDPIRERVRTETQRLIKRLIKNSNDNGLNWFAFTLTGFQDNTKIAQRFVYFKYNKGSKPEDLWDQFIDNPDNITSHYNDKLSLSKMYSFGMWPSSIRRAHLLNDPNCTYKNMHNIVYSPSNDSTRLVLWDGETVTHGQLLNLSPDEVDKFKAYLKWIFSKGQNTILYTVSPLISEHSILSRSIGELYISESVPFLDIDDRNNLIEGLHHVALGLAAQFFVLDQEELTQEIERVKKYEERLNLLYDPLDRLAEALDTLKASTQQINMALYEPSENIFKHHRELAEFFEPKTIYFGNNRVKIVISHDPSCYNIEHNNTKEGVVVLCLILARMLGFENKLYYCHDLDEIIHVFILLYNKSSHNSNSDLLNIVLTHMAESVIDNNMLYNFIYEKKMDDIRSLLNNIKSVIHDPFKPDKKQWSLRPIIIACNINNKLNKTITYNTNKCRVEGSISVSGKLFDNMCEISPYSLSHILEFIIRLIYHNNSIGSFINAVNIYNYNSFYSIEFFFCKNDYNENMSAPVKIINERIKNGVAFDLNYARGDSIWPFMYLVDMGKSWEYIVNPKDISLLTAKFDDKLVNKLPILCLKRNDKDNCHAFICSHHILANDVCYTLWWHK